MKSFAQVNVLPARARQTCGQLRVDERARERDHAAREPRTQDQDGRVYLLRDVVRVDEDACADDPAHHDHRRVEQTKLAREMRAGASLALRSHQMSRKQAHANQLPCTLAVKTSSMARLRLHPLIASSWRRLSVQTG